MCAKSTCRRQARSKNAHKIYMCSAMFKWIRLYMDFTPQEMREILGLTRRTHQSYESGHRKVSLEAANASWGIYVSDREFQAGIGDRVDQNLKKGDLNE